METFQAVTSKPLMRAMLTEPRSSKAWQKVKPVIRKALAQKSRIQRAGRFNWGAELRRVQGRSAREMLYRRVPSEEQSAGLPGLPQGQFHGCARVASRASICHDLHTDDR